MRAMKLRGNVSSANKKEPLMSSLNSSGSLVGLSLCRQEKSGRQDQHRAKVVDIGARRPAAHQVAQRAEEAVAVIVFEHGFRTQPQLFGARCAGGGGRRAGGGGGAGGAGGGAGGRGRAR